MEKKQIRKSPVFSIDAVVFATILVLGLLIVNVQAQQTSGTADTYKEGSGESTPVSRDAMLNANVDSFADRLHKNGGSLQEWMKLVRYYGVLGKNKKALKALADAKKDLRKNPQAVRRLNRFAKFLGLKS